MRRKPTQKARPKVIPGTKGERIGTGASAETFVWGGDHVLKLFYPEFDYAVDLEVERSVAVYDCGVPSPEVCQIVEVEGRRGIIYSQVEGPTLMSFVAERGVDDVARAMAEVHAAIHRVEAKGLPTIRELVEVAPGLDDRERAESLARIDRMPSGPGPDVICHGDLHPGNIVITQSGPVISDWVNATAAHPAADVARTLILIGYQGLTDQTPAEIRDSRRALVASYLATYLEISDVTREQVALCEPVMAAALLRQVPDHCEREALESLIRT